MNDLITENNYIYIPNFIFHERAVELSKKFINYCNSKQIQGDSQIPESSAAYNYVDFLELLEFFSLFSLPGITSLLSEASPG